MSTTRIRRICHRLFTDDGATAIEYGIMISLIGAVVVAAVTTLGSKTLQLFELVPTVWK